VSFAGSTFVCSSSTYNENQWWETPLTRRDQALIIYPVTILQNCLPH
jgi:hypothetical protein